MPKVIWERAPFQYVVQVKYSERSDWDLYCGYHTKEEAIADAKDANVYHTVRIVDTWAEGELDD